MGSFLKKGRSAIVYLFAHECFFLEPFSEQTSKVNNLFGKKDMLKMLNGEIKKKSLLESKNVRWWRGSKHLFKSARSLFFSYSKSVRATQIL